MPVLRNESRFVRFAPSILEHKVGEYFEQTHPSPDMLMVYQIRPEKRAVIPAVTHVDGSGRLQTVSEKANPRYFSLISEGGYSLHSGGHNMQYGHPRIGSS